MFEFIKNIFYKKDQSINIYQYLGEGPGIQSLVNNFYEIMENDPKATDCLHVHELESGKISKLIKEKLLFFLSGWLGGPQLFAEKYGHPRMRARHQHIIITPVLADQWLYCMEKSLIIHPKKINKKIRRNLLNSFKALSLRIINSPG